MTEQQGPKHGQSELSGNGQSVAQQYITQHTQVAQQINAGRTIEDVVAVLAPIGHLSEAEQIAFLKELSNKNDLAAADIIQAFLQLSDNKAVRKEARRRVVILENQDIYSEWEPPTAESAASPSITLDERLKPTAFSDDEEEDDEEEDDEEDSGALSDLLASFEEILGSNTVGGPAYLETVGDFLDAWVDGDYEAAYESLSDDSPLRDGLSEEEWVKSRTKWAELAQPDGLRVTALEALKDEQGQDMPLVDVCWSATFEDLPEETLPELPLSTVVFEDTGRRWFWTRYSVVETDDDWLIKDMTDEAANAFRLPREVLEQRLAELDAKLNSEVDRLEEVENEDEEDEDEEVVVVDAEVEDLENEDEDEEDEDEEEFEELDESRAAEQLSSLFGGMSGIVRDATYYLHYNDALIAQDPQSSQDYYGRAVSITGAVNDLERSAVYAQQAAEHAPEVRGQALRNLAYTYMMLSEQAHNDDDHEREEYFLEKVEPTAREAVAAEDNPKARILLGTVLVNLDDDDLLDEAEACFRMAEKGPNEPEDLIEIERGLGEIAELRDDKEMALRHYQQLTHLEPDSADVWQKVGLYQTELKHFQEGIEALQRSIDLDLYQEETYSLLAFAYTQTGDLNKARETAHQGITNNPDSALLHSTLALTYMNSGDLQSAEKYQRRAEHLDSDEPLVQEVHEALKDMKRQQSGHAKNKAKTGKHKKR